MKGGNGLDPRRTIAELKELRWLTGNADGAQRVAWTETWAKARRWLTGKMSSLPVEREIDEAGNLWFTLAGRSKRALVIGGHLDSVPNGGWLDGCLNVIAGMEVMRRIERQGVPPVTVRLVDWADEEGARFGRSLFGSSCVSGAMDPVAMRGVVDSDGVTLQDALAAHGVDLRRAKRSGRQLRNAAAYLELHIEQGPVLESLGKPMGAVLGTFGVQRHAIRFSGQAAHAGSTPMAERRDALAGVSRLHLAVRDIAVKHRGVCTVGKVTTQPGIVTAVAGTAEMLLDQRHLEAKKLARLLADARLASERIAREERIRVEWHKMWSIQPFLFHRELIRLAEDSVKEICGTSHRLPSGPLHDAAEVCRTGVPTAMLFVQSLRGISHNQIEDTKERHLVMAVRALDRLAARTTAWIERRGARSQTGPQGETGS